ncbi:unnamed protein product [Rotaria sp. Silwood1]|nr:unnamed protein product [Rotaria sp. Silwood1]
MVCDVQLNVPASQCQNELQSLQLLPPDERSSKRWNSGMYDVDGGNGWEALDPSIIGYSSRSVANRSDFPPRSRWYPSSVNPDLQFYGDTSSDEIVGHQFVHPLVHDLFAENDDERQHAYILILNITTHIRTHDWYLIGENHNHTRWSIWNPLQINNDSYYQESRGLNSPQIFAFLIQTYADSGDKRFLDAVNLLIQPYQYDINLINQKMIAVCDNNFSDDELAYLSYFNLIYGFHTIISSTHGMWYLRRLPLHLIHWQQFNSDRLDVQLNVPASQCQNELQSVQLLPPDERSSKRWNSGMYDVDGGNGWEALDPSSFLISYWGMRYFNLLGA